jgi:hypothetical protein
VGLGDGVVRTGPGLRNTYEYRAFTSVEASHIHATVRIELQRGLVLQIKPLNTIILLMLHYFINLSPSLGLFPSPFFIHCLAFYWRMLRTHECGDLMPQNAEMFGRTIIWFCRKVGNTLCH